MQLIDDLTNFGKRVRELGLEIKALARKAGVAPSTAFRVARGDVEGRVSTYRKLFDVLAAEEIRRAEHLMTLPHVRAALAPKYPDIIKEDAA